MKRISKIIAAAVLAAAGISASLRAETGVAVSSMTAKTHEEAAKVMSESNGMDSDKAIQDHYFDGNKSGGTTGALAVAGKFGNGTNAALSQNVTAAQKTLGAKVPGLSNSETLSNKPGVKQKDLGQLTVSRESLQSRERKPLVEILGRAAVNTDGFPG